MQFNTQLVDSLRPGFDYLMAHAMVRYGLIGSILLLLVVFSVLYAHQKKASDTAVDFSAIAGDDINATQLDLAKAYLEMGDKNNAKIILRQTIKEGAKAHKTHARQLLKSL